MGPRTPCPHPAHLRLFLNNKAQTHETESVRAHLEQCEACRATLAASGADESFQNTFADQASPPVSQMVRQGDGREAERLKTAGAAEPTIQMSVPPPIDTSKRASILQLSDSIHRPDSRTAGDPNLTCLLVAGADSSQPGASDFVVSLAQPDTNERLPSSPTTLESVTVPGYDILEELGRGGMGVVYKARHHRLQRLVALKMVLAGAHVGAVGLARFRAEAEAVAKLSHSNIVQIYETGEHEGRPFFSLEFVDGGSLDQRIAQSPISPRGAAQLIETLARTMAVAHERGIIHRDLKPANILLAKVGSQSSLVRGRDVNSSSLPADHWSRTTVPKIADFGLAKQVDDDSSQTRSGTILGTPSYMAPEQAGGRNREIGPAADIYSLGAILYELLVGRPPFKAGNPIDTIRQVVEQDPIPPRQLEPRVPPDLETICLKCLEKDPARRFASAIALADDLRRFVDGDPIHARPTPAWERAWKWGKRRKALVALYAVIAVAVVGGVLFVFWHNVSLRGKLDMAIAAERRSKQRAMDALEERRLTLVHQEGQKLFDSARVAAAASDWPTARLDLEKALATIRSESHLDALRESALVLLTQVENELRVEADRRASRARLQSFVILRDEAQFLGTLYTGMDLAANLQAARTAAQKALAVYGVVAGQEARPAFDLYQSEAQKRDVQGDCSGLLLILAETEAQSASGRRSTTNDQFLRKALSCLEQAGRLGAPVRALQLRRARYLSLLGEKALAAKAEQAAQGAALKDVLDHFLMADELYRREQFDAAIKEFDQVLERKPGHFWAQYLGALCLLRQQRPAEARALLSACLAERSDFVWLYLLRGFAQQELQAWGAAESDFQKASQMPLDENARYVLFVNRGVLRVRTDRIADAIADLESATKLKPKAYQAFVNLAQAYRRLNRPGRALEQLDRAVELEPGLAHVYRLRARLYLERKEYEPALANLDQAIARENAGSPFQVDDQVERGRLLLESGKPALALAALDTGLSFQRDHSVGQRLRAETLFRLGRFEEVVQAFDRYLETGKPLESVYRGRGLARAELGQYPGAIDDFTKALELHPTSAVQAYRGWTYLVVDAPKLALRDFELAIELDSKNGDAYNGRGFAQARLGRHREALLDAALALRHGPPSPRSYYNAARIYAQCPGPYPRTALELVRQALELLPPADRPAFWSTNVEKDQALAALHRHPLYVKLEAELSRGR